MLPRTVAVVALLAIASGTAPSRGAIAGADRKDAYTQHDEIRAKLDFNRRTLAKAYEQVGRRNAKWDDAAMEFLDAAGLGFAYAGQHSIYVPGPRMTFDHLEKLAKAALDAGCDDPLVRYCHGAFLHDQGRLAEARPLVLSAADDLEKSQYPPNRIFAAHNRALKLLDPQKDKDEIARRRKAVLAAALRAATMKFEPQDQRIVLSHMSGTVGNDVKEQRAFYDALRKLPDADPWIVNMIGGDFHISNAWAWRGSGWARDVTEQGWQGFFTNLKQARDCLARAHELHPEYPEAAALMITVAMGGGDQLAIDKREWFDKATAAQIDHEDAYARYRGALRPRWGGSYKAMHDLAIECLDSNRYDTLVPYAFLDTIYDIAHDTGRSDLWAHEPTFQQARRVLTRYAERHPALSPGYLSHLLGISWRAGQYAEAKSLLDRLGDRLDDSYVERFAPLPKLAIEQIHAMTGPLGAKIRAAEAFLEQDDVPSAVKAYDAMLDTDAKPSGAAYARARRNELDLWHRAGTDWVTLAPDKKLKDWYPSGNEWSVDEQGRLVCTFGRTREIFIIYPADLGRAYELRCTVEFDPSQRPRPYAGAVVAYAGPEQRYSLNVSERGEFGIHSGAKYGRAFKIPATKSFDVHVMVWQDTLTTIVNGKRIEHNYRIGNDVPAEGTYFGLVAYWSPPGEVIRFSNIQVRRLHAAPGNPADD